MSESDAKLIATTGGRRKRRPAGELFDRLRALDGVTVAVNGSSPVAKPVPAPTPRKPARTRSHKKAWELAQDAKNEYERCTTDAEKIARFGANSRGNPSLFQAYAWYAEHYEQSDGRPLTAKGLQNSLYQHRFPPK